jgi:hypothetical protein
MIQFDHQHSRQHTVCKMAAISLFGLREIIFFIKSSKHSTFDIRHFANRENVTGNTQRPDN